MASRRRDSRAMRGAASERADGCEGGALSRKMDAILPAPELATLRVTPAKRLLAYVWLVFMVADVICGFATHGFSSKVLALGVIAAVLGTVSAARGFARHPITQQAVAVRADASAAERELAITQQELEQARSEREVDLAPYHQRIEQGTLALPLINAAESAALQKARDDHQRTIADLQALHMDTQKSFDAAKKHLLASEQQVHVERFLKQQSIWNAPLFEMDDAFKQRLDACGIHSPRTISPTFRGV